MGSEFVYSTAWFFNCRAKWCVRYVAVVAPLILLQTVHGAMHMSIGIACGCWHFWFHAYGFAIDANTRQTGRPDRSQSPLQIPMMDQTPLGPAPREAADSEETLEGSWSLVRKHLAWFCVVVLALAGAISMWLDIGAGIRKCFGIFLNREWAVICCDLWECKCDWSM